MNALKLVFIGMFLTASSAVMAQVTITIGSPPAWGPVGYAGVRYYYLPDVEAYYDVQTSQFIYFQTTRWVYATSLPSRYRYYNLYDGYKVVMTGYNGNSPYDHFDEHKRNFKKATYHGERQETNGHSPGNSKGKHGNGKSNKH